MQIDSFYCERNNYKFIFFLFIFSSYFSFSSRFLCFSKYSSANFSISVYLDRFLHGPMYFLTANTTNKVPTKTPKNLANGGILRPFRIASGCICLINGFEIMIDASQLTTKIHFTNLRLCLFAGGWNVFVLFFSARRNHWFKLDGSS